MSNVFSQPRLALATIVAGLVFAGVAGGLERSDASRQLEQRLLASVQPAQAQPAAAAEETGTSAYAALRTLLGARAERKLASRSDVYRRTRKLLPDRFAEYETRRFVVLCDGKPGWSRQQGQLLERTYHQFQRYTRRIGIEPEPLRYKLVCVLFQEYDDYRQFAKAHDDVTAEWISGYYSPKHDRIVFYNIETNPEYAWARPANDRGSDAAVARGRLNEDYEAAAIATTIHEAIHQLTFHTKVQSAQIQNPLWISEGLATAFETDKPNVAFGPDREYPMRREQFERLLDDGEMIPLRELVAYTEMPNNQDDTIAAVYHESYALVTWLSRFRSTELRKYLESLRQERPGRPTPQTRRLAVSANHPSSPTTNLDQRSLTIRVAGRSTP
ncbi:MAG: DUF1570 domain-containing protein [Planctomycetota bacterium]